MMTRAPTLLLALLLQGLTSILPGADAADSILPSCASDADCEIALAAGSLCQDGTCTNPFYNGGCLKQKMPDWHRVRACSSEDPPDAAEKGICQHSQFDYMELRVATQSWDSAYLSAWIMQIILSEILEVPATLETGDPNGNLDFYDPKSSFSYKSVPYDWDALELASKVGDCTVVNNDNLQKDEDYQSCAHVVTEVFADALGRGTEEALIKDKVIDTPMLLGASALNSWYVPRYTAERYPWVTSYLGIRGDANRRFLAETFKRPTTWKQYCEEVSLNLCAEDDGVAKRAPETGSEEQSMFNQEYYTGHFRHTAENNCTAFPDTCTGHVAAYPCSFSGVLIQQAHHLGINLKSGGPSPNGGYEYNTLVEIWQAANATKSDVAMIWWSPDTIYSYFLGTDAEFTAIGLPPPTLECLESRVDPLDECSGDPDLMFGSPLGACGYAPQPQYKVAASGLADIIKRPHDKLGPLESPAYEAIQNFVISEFQLDTIFNRWFDMGKDDPTNYNIRAAACDWVIENFDLVQSFIPESYPRAIEDLDQWSTVLFRAALALACVAIVMTSLALALVYVRRQKKNLYHAQFGFLALFLSGLVMVSIGSLFLVVPLNDFTCSLSVWLVSLGYCIELGPLVLKVDAINRVVSTGNMMKRVRLPSKSLARSVAVVMAFVFVLLVTWMAVDAPREISEYFLSDSLTSNNETIVTSRYTCASDTRGWLVLSISWQGLLLLYALAMAFMASRGKGDLNDTFLLSVVIFSQLCFVGLRATVLALLGQESDSMAYRSIVLSSDCIWATLLLVYPKIIAQAEDQESDEALPDFFVQTTIMTSHVTGFTAWSSVRDPSQVFKFLEAIYGVFDEIGEKRHVYTVETVRDCYVAATGIPTAQKDHAVIMAKFARDIMFKMHKMTNKLELEFGPDTGDLSLKIALHSGPVTGGFLKGKGSRFQIFGDTVNITTKLEECCQEGVILMSADTANFLIEAGKESWLEKLKNKSDVGVHGEIQMYRMKQVKTDSDFEADLSGGPGMDSSMAKTPEEIEAERRTRLVDWNVSVMEAFLKKIVARRIAATGKGFESLSKKSRDEVRADDSFAVFSEGSSVRSGDLAGSTFEAPSTSGGSNESPFNASATMPFYEVKEIITLPEYDSKVAKKTKDAEQIELDEQIIFQLKMFVTQISQMYRANPFHGFEHASHVVQAMTKMMKRIMEGSELNLDMDEEDRQIYKSKVAASLHDHTYGISSDPLTQLACVFSALIHDVDHPAVPNNQLIKENPLLAVTYKEKSVAEQNSVDLSWNLLLEPKFKKLRETMWGNKTEDRIRFRALVVNSIMATDLGDKQLKELRNSRWEKAFAGPEDPDQSIADTSISLTVSSSSKRAGVKMERDAVNRKATIVIEHLIQASDVSHTMQHWHIYLEWNEKLFREMYNAYQDGRSETDPSTFWYKGELGFFDFYIVPLAKKLKDCGVFGVTSAENLNYASRNRKMWEQKGEQVLAGYLEKYQPAPSPEAPIAKDATFDDECDLESGKSN